MGNWGIGPLLVPHWGGIRWLLRDEFNDTRAAGAVNGTPATPGPGTRTGVIDTGNALTIAGGVATATATGVADPLLPYGTYARVAGRTLFGRVTTTGRAYIGWDIDGASVPANGALDLQPAFGLYTQPGNTRVAPDYVAGTEQVLALGLRAAGTWFWRRVGGVWLMLWESMTTVNTPMYPMIAWRTLVSSCDSIRIPDATFVPDPLAYDTFTRAALGSTETTGPDGQSVPALAWATVAGTPAINANTLVFTAAGIAVLPALSTADLLDTWTITTPAAGVTAGGIIVRYTDADNYWYVRLIPGTAGTDFQLIERNATVETARATADIDWAAATAYQVCVVCHGSTWWKIYQGTTSPATLSLDYTAANTFNQTAGITGVRDEGNSNFIFDNMTIWARGTNGEYATLDRYSI